MKRIINLTLVLFVIATVSLLSSCKENDLVTPYIVLDGDNPLTITLNDYFDPRNPGATGHDNVDGSLDASQITINHNVPTNGLENDAGYTTRLGEYTVTYTATDEAGNVKQKDRTVKVVSSCEKFMGEYMSTTQYIAAGPIDHIIDEVTSAYKVTLTSDNQSNWKFKVSRLSNIVGINAQAYLGKDEDGDDIVGTQAPGGYTLSLLPNEFFVEGYNGTDSTLYVKTKGLSNSTTGIHESSIDTLKPYKLILRYEFEIQWPYDSLNPDNNHQVGTIEETLEQLL